jgi:hypothetical protein
MGDMTDKVIQSYVYYKEQAFLVSTINRDSSAAGAYRMRYAETMVWEWDPVTRDRKSDRILWTEEDRENCMDAHFLACRELRDKGRIPNEDDDDDD